MRALLAVLGLFRSRSGLLLLGALVSLLSVAAGVALLTASGGTVAAALAGAVLVPGLLAGLGPARVVLRYLERLVSHDATFRALADLRVWFFRRLAGSAAVGLGFRRAGDVLSRLVDDVATLDGLYLRILLPLAAALLLWPALVLTVGRHDAGAAAVEALLFPAAALVLPLMAARATRSGGRRLAAATGALRVAVLDLLSGLREVRAFGAEDRMIARVQAREGAMLAEQDRLSHVAALAGAAAFLAAQLGIVLALVTVLPGPASVAAVFLAVAAFEAIGGLPRAGALAGYAAAAAERVMQAAAAPPLAPDPASPEAAPRGSALRFEAVGFRWLPDRAPVFDGLVLDVPEGARIAVLGPSGAGKSTLAALAMRIAAPDRGRILLGGTDVARMRAADLRARIAWLGQATHLFDDTVRGNLLLGDPQADEPALWAALEAAQLAAVVRALPEGLDTWVGEQGAALSGGEGRRLALARALLSKAPILILDEPAAGLDAETERAFHATLNEAVGGRTLILIVHRLTGVERLDRIWRLSAGRAVAAAG